MKIGYHLEAAGPADVAGPWYQRAHYNVSLTWELSVPRIVAFEHAEQLRK
jgi:hypothetical protein